MAKTYHVSVEPRGKHWVVCCERCKCEVEFFDKDIVTDAARGHDCDGRG